MSPHSTWPVNSSAYFQRYRLVISVSPRSSLLMLQQISEKKKLNCSSDFYDLEEDTRDLVIFNENDSPKSLG